MDEKEMKELEERLRHTKAERNYHFYQPVGQFIEHVDTVNFSMDKDGNFHFENVGQVKGAPREKEQPGERNKTGLDAARQSKLNEIIGILKKGNWKQPATSANVELLLNTVFGKDTSLLDEGDVEKCETLWALVEKGRGNRMTIIPANIAGFFSEENLLIGSPKEISDDLFGENNSQRNCINDGKSNSCSGSFGAVIPFLKKYTNKIIRQV